MIFYLFLFFVFLVLSLGYFLYTPVPTRSKDPAALRIMVAISKMMHFLGCFLETTHLGIYPYLMRKLTKSSKAVDSDLEIEDSMFRGVPVRIYRQTNRRSTDNPGLIFIHGGGFVCGNIDSCDAAVRELVKGSTSGMVAISIEYRLSPEHPFPTPFDDCFAASCHFLDNAATFGVNQECIAIVGESAGGALAAAVLNKMISNKVERKPKRLVLIYPTLQGYNFRTPSYLKYNGKGERGLLTSSMMVHFWTNYAFGKSRGINQLLRNAHISESQKRSEPFTYIDNSHLPNNIVRESEKYPKGNEIETSLLEASKSILADPYCSPLLARDAVLQKYPPTLIITTDFDPLRDDGIILEDRLRKLGVMVSYSHMAGHDHGVFNGVRYTGHRILRDEIQQFLKDFL